MGESFFVSQKVQPVNQNGKPRGRSSFLSLRDSTNRLLAHLAPLVLLLLVAMVAGDLAERDPC